MRCKLFLAYLILLVIFFLTSMAAAQTSCFKSETRELAERKARVWQEPDPDYDPVLGFNPKKGPRRGALEVDAAGLAKPLNCVANKDPRKGSGTTPKFHCSVPGVLDDKGVPIRYKVKPHFKGQ